MVPNTIIKTMSDKSGKSEKEVEKLWDTAKELASEELGKKEKDFKDKDWAYVTGILKKMLKIKESITSKKAKTFFESGFSAEDYIDNFVNYPTEDDDEVYEIDMDGLDTSMIPDFDDDEFEPDFEVEENMVSGSFTAPNGPISGPVTPPEEEFEIEDSFHHIYKGGRK